jgi:hypothetical protein
MGCMQIQNLFDYATWDDGEIKPREDWRNHIVAAIDNCKVAVLLVSPDFLSSEFVTDQEIPHLLRLREEGQVAVLPLIVPPCAWEVVEWLAEIQLHPYPAVLEAKIRALISSRVQPGNSGHPGRQRSAARTAPPAKRLSPYSQL